MSDKPKQDDPIHISSDDARGAGDANDGTRGETLVPMLIIGLILATLGVTIVLMFVR